MTIDDLFQEELPAYLRDGLSSVELDNGVLSIEPRDESAGEDIARWVSSTGFAEQHGVEFQVREPRVYELAPPIDEAAVQRAIDRRHLHNPPEHPYIQRFGYRNIAAATAALNAMDDAHMEHWKEYNNDCN